VEIGNKIHIYDREPGTAFMLNRQEFICQLKRDAEKLGVNIQTNEKIKSSSDLDGDYIIDASGCPSSIKRELGFNKGLRGISYQQTIENCNLFDSEKINIKFLSSCGYIWIFPRNPEKREINLGIGFTSDFNYNLKKILEDFKIEHNITGQVNYTCGGLIPLGLQPPFKHKNILFVGDAGVGTFITSGAGIYRALISGDIAGKCIATGYPSRYPILIYKRFLRWEIICKVFTKTSFVFRKINPDLALWLINSFSSLTKPSH